MKALAIASFSIAGLFAALSVLSIVASGELDVTSALILIGAPALVGIVLWMLSPRFTSRVDTTNRVVGFVAGVVLVLGGLFWVAYVNEYGGGTSYEIQEVGGTGSVYVIDEQAQTETLVFEGTTEEARRYVEDRREAGRDVTLPYMTVGAGAVLTLATLGLGWRRTGDESMADSPNSHETV